MVWLQPSECYEAIETKIPLLEKTLIPPDLRVHLKLHKEQDQGSQGKLKQSIVVLCSSNMTLMYLSTLVCHKNGLQEQEWSQFEFYPDLETQPELGPANVATTSLRNGQVGPLQFKMKLTAILSCMLQPATEALHLIYKKRTLPQL